MHTTTIHLDVTAQSSNRTILGQSLVADVKVSIKIIVAKQT